jgi:hypothetical protein
MRRSLSKQVFTFAEQLERYDRMSIILKLIVRHDLISELVEIGFSRRIRIF